VSTDALGNPAVSEQRVPIVNETDIVVARQQGRVMAERLGFGRSDLALIATAISEVARNIILYAGRGEIVLERIDDGRRGIVVVARDEGPGIPDLELALRDGYSSSGSLGLGLPGAKRLMDEFAIVSEVGKGTTVTMRKWIL
jgi:serine/threonine-protein kinase RsbT